MKLAKRKIITLSIFVIFILIETISFAVYQTAVEEDNYKQMIEVEIEEGANLKPEEQETLSLINEYRKQNGLEELKASAKLQEVAELKAEDIVRHEYFSHTSEKLGTPFQMLKSNNIDYKIAGENLAGNTTPQRAVEAWINSDSHRENILEEQFEYTGIFVTNSPIYGKVFVQIFLGTKS